MGGLTSAQIALYQHPVNLGTPCLKGTARGTGLGVPSRVSVRLRLPSKDGGERAGPRSATTAIGVHRVHALHSAQHPARARRGEVSASETRPSNSEGEEGHLGSPNTKEPHKQKTCDASLQPKQKPAKGGGLRDAVTRGRIRLRLANGRRLFSTRMRNPGNRTRSAAHVRGLRLVQKNAN